MKAENLQRLRAQGLPVPPFAVIRDGCALPPELSGAARFAVRSTFAAEDSEKLSFAGQFETLLNVAPADVPELESREDAEIWMCLDARVNRILRMRESALAG